MSKGKEKDQKKTHDVIPLTPPESELRVASITNMYTLEIIEQNSDPIFSLDGFGEIKLNGEVSEDPQAIVDHLKKWSIQYFENYKAQLK